MKTFWILLVWLAGLCVAVGGCDSRHEKAAVSAPASSANEPGDSRAAPARVNAIPSRAVKGGGRSAVAGRDAGRGRVGDELTTEPSVLVYGRVTTERGDAASSVVVTLNGLTPGKMLSGTPYTSKLIAETVTDADGAYEVRGGGMDIFHLLLKGDIPEMQVALDSGSKPGSGKPKTGLTRIKKDIQLLEDHGISGQVVNESGQAMAGVPVHLFPAMTPGDRRMMKALETTSTAAGTFEMAHVARGSWTIGTVHPDYAPVTDVISVPTTGPVTLRLVARGGTLTGHVYDKASGSPLSDVSLMLSDMNPDMGRSIGKLGVPLARSGPDGAFRFDHVTSGVKVLRLLPVPEAKLGIAPPGLPPVSISELGTTDVLVYLYPGHVVKGRVFDKDTDEALAGAKVKVFGAEGVSDGEGLYRLAHVFSGSGSRESNYLSMSVELDGYGVSPESPGASSLRVVLPGDVLEVTRDIPMIKKLVVKGVVVTTEEKPIPHAKVALHNGRTFRSKEEMQPVKEDGSFELETLPFVEVVVEAEAAGYAAAISGKIDVATEDVDGVKVVLEPGAAIEGRVVGPDGAPVPSAQVSQKVEYGIFSTQKEVARSGTNGGFLITDAPKEVELQAGMEGFATSAKVNLSLTPGETRGGVELVLRTGLVIAGRVIDASGQPVSKVFLNCQDASFAYSYSATADEQGRFEFKDMVDGTYQVTAFGSQQKTVKGIKPGTKDVEIVLGEPYKPKGSNTLIGTVVDDLTSKPIRTFEIKGYESQVTKLSEPGQFQIVNIPDRMAYYISISSEGFEPKTFKTKSGSDGEKIEQEFRLGKSGAIIGRVVEKDGGKPVPGLTVINWGAGRMKHERERGGPKSHTITDEKGNFVLAPAPVGENYVEVKARAPYSVVNKSVTVRSEQTADMGDIALSRGGTITGRVVRGADDEPVASEPVRVSAWSQEVQVSESSVSDPEGKFTFEALPAMNYAISAQSVTVQRVLPPEGKVDVTLRLGGVTIKGKVTRGGVPVEEETQLFAMGPDGHNINGRARMGEYEIKNLVPGSYRFEVTVLGEGMNSRREEIVEVPDKAEFIKEFQLPNGRLQVSVINAAGEPVGDVPVTLTLVTAGRDQQRVTRMINQVRSDAAGKAAFGGMPAGTYLVTVIKDGVKSQLMDIAVGEEQTVPAQLRLSN